MPLSPHKLAGALAGLALLVGAPAASAAAPHGPHHHHRHAHGGRGSAARYPYYHGGCTAWAWAHRTDLPTNLGNARSWAVNAARAGFPVDGTPEVGAIAVYQPGVYGAFAPFGHVAVVKQVSGARILISEANFNPRLADYGDRESDVRWTGIARVQFIHRKPAPKPVIPNVPPVVDPVITVPPGTSIGTYTAPGGGDGTQPQSQPQPGPNLLANPGFEAVPGIAPWFRNALASAVNVQVYTDAPHSGRWWLQTNTKVPGGSIAQDLPSAPTAGATYRFSVWLKSASGRPYSACAVIWALGPVNTPGQTCAPIGGAWQQLTTTLTIPAGSRKLRAELYEGTIGDNLDVDDASLVQLP